MCGLAVFVSRDAILYCTNALMNFQKSPQSIGIFSKEAHIPVPTSAHQGLLCPPLHSQSKPAIPLLQSLAGPNFREFFPQSLRLFFHQFNVLRSVLEPFRRIESEKPHAWEQRGEQRRSLQFWGHRRSAESGGFSARSTAPKRGRGAARFPALSRPKSSQPNCECKCESNPNTRPIRGSEPGCRRK